MEYTLQQIEAFKQVTHVGNIIGTMYRITNESSLADFLWQDQGYFQQSSVTREVLEDERYFTEFIWEGESE